MKQKITVLVLLAGLVMMLAGCGENFSVKKGEQVRFKVSSNEHPGTKTQYGGYTAGDNYERIEWKAGDNIRIFSMNTGIVKANWPTSPAHDDYYDYEILQTEDSPITNSGRTSKAKLKKPDEGIGLVWMNDPYDATLYGVYPSATPRYDPDDATKIIGFQGMTIPASQSGTQPNMQTAYMVSAPSEFSDSGTTDVHGQVIPEMEMKFYPFFNAFDIEFKTLDGGSYVVNSVALESVSNGLSGAYQYIIDENTTVPTIYNVLYTNSGNTVTADLNSMSEADRTVSSTHPVRVTLLTLPPMSTTPNGLTGMTLKLTYNGNKTKSLPLSYSGHTATNPKWIEFAPFHKARINGLALSVLPDEIEFKFVVQPWDQEAITINTSTGSINMSNVTWMNSKVVVDGTETNTVVDADYSVYMYYKPTVNGETYTANNGYYPAQGYFTVNYPQSGLFKIGLIPAYGETTVDESRYEIYIYNSTTQSWDLHKSASTTAENTQGVAITNNTVYFQVRAAANQDHAQHKAQVDIWFKPTGSNEWISAYSEVRANYALIIPATSTGN